VTWSYRDGALAPDRNLEVSGSMLRIVPNDVSYPALLAMMPYAPLNVPGTTLPEFPPPAPAGFKPELS